MWNTVNTGSLRVDTLTNYQKVWANFTCTLKHDRKQQKDAAFNTAGVTLPHMDLVSTCRTRMWWKVAQQWCSISKTHTGSLLTQRRLLLSRLKAFELKPNCWKRACTQQVKSSQKIRLKLNLYSLNCGGDVRTAQGNLNPPPLLQTLTRSTSCCYDNLIIVYHDCIFVYVSMWGSWKIMCECEVALFGKVPNTRLQGKQL